VLAFCCATALACDRPNTAAPARDAAAPHPDPIPITPAPTVPPTASALPKPAVPRCLDHPYAQVLVDGVHAVLGSPPCNGWTNAVVIRIRDAKIARFVDFDGTETRAHVGKRVPPPPAEFDRFFRDDVRVGVCVTYVCRDVEE
jgi:hypothetical protein